MSRGGRLRLALALTRSAVLVGLVAALGWGIWLVVEAIRHPAPAEGASMAGSPLRPPELFTTREGVLDQAWLARTLALPAGASLMELDLSRLRARLLEDRQVLTATLTRHFPDRLRAQISERVPIARVRLEVGGVQSDYLVARDGVIYPGTGYDPALLRTLPWLDGLTLTREGAGLRATEDVESVARLLAAAQFSAVHLYRDWQTISLARLASDRELEVTTKQGVTVVFSAKGEFFPQLGKVDYLVEKLSRLPHGRARIDLSLGREVPLTIEAPPPPATKASRPSAPAAATSPVRLTFQIGVKP
jgi:cell division septal protein FtsQ